MILSRLPFAASVARRFSSAALDSFHASEKPRSRNFGINRVELLGAVGYDPKYLISRNGDEFATFRVYTHVDYRKRDGELIEQNAAHDISVFGGLVKYVKNNVRKGTRVFVCGRLSYFDQIDGDNKHRMVKISADTILAVQHNKSNTELSDEDGPSYS